MTFDPREFLRVANELAQQTNDEAKLRSAIGRAYYAVMLCARERLGIRAQRRVHRLVISRLRSVDRAAGDQLAKLETLRGVSDYDLIIDDLTQKDWQSNWRVASNFASHILRRIERLRL